MLKKKKAATDKFEKLCTEAEQAYQSYLEAQCDKKEKAKIVTEFDRMTRVLNLVSEHFRKMERAIMVNLSQATSLYSDYARPRSVTK